MSSVQISQLKKNYGTLEVLHGINLDVEDGQFVVLLGPSGCGKSTLLRMLAGLEDITSGEVTFGENVVNDVHPKDRNIAMVFQNYALYAHMKVRDNMAFSMRLKKESPDFIAERVDWAASVLSLEPYLDRYPKELSGGQRQRVAMGRAIVRNPDVFLFDEPLSNLDAKLRVQMRTEIKELHQRLKTTTVYVTHDQIEAMTLADLVVIMKDGVIEQQGSPLDIYDNPKNLFVAQFIGSPGINIIEGTVNDAGDAVDIDNSSQSLPLPAGYTVSPRQKVLFGIRPEHLTPTVDDRGDLSVKVNVVEPTGAETHVYCQLEGHDLCAITQERLALEPESSIKLSIDTAHIHIFDEDSQVSISKR